MMDGVIRCLFPVSTHVYIDRHSLFKVRFVSFITSSSFVRV